MRQSCAAKAAVVAADERESGERALLNFGHTFGHALEADTGFGDALLHGEAVALGMRLAFDLSVRLGFCPPAAAARVRRHLAAVGLPHLARGARRRQARAPSCCWRHMRKDKKVRDGRITLILARDIGEAFVCGDVVPATLAGFLAEAVEPGRNSLASAPAVS